MGKSRYGIGFALLIVTGGLSLAPDYSGLAAKSSQSTESFPAYTMPDYGVQKVVYHVSNTGHWYNRSSEARRLIGVLSNHVKAVAPDTPELKVVFNSEGIDLLRRIKADPELSIRFEALRRNGVHILICMNSINSVGATPDMLPPVTSVNLVEAGVAEVAALQRQGYSYIRF